MHLCNAIIKKYEYLLHRYKLYVRQWICRKLINISCQKNIFLNESSIIFAIDRCKHVEDYCTKCIKLCYYRTKIILRRNNVTFHDDLLKDSLHLELVLEVCN